MADDSQFDGQNPVAGYTLFHGKDGKSYYLKGENLSDDDVTQRVQKIRGQSSAPNLVTGEGMEAQAQQQAHNQFTPNQWAGTDAQGKPIFNKPPNVIDRAADELDAQQTRLGAAQNRAMHSPVPFTDASMAYAPVSAAKALIGAKLGGMAGGAIGGDTGQVIGGALGGFAGGVMPTSRSSVAKAIINPSTLEPRPAVKVLPWMNNERVTALGDLIDPNLPKVRNMVQAADESFANRTKEIGDTVRQENLFGQENASAVKRNQADMEAIPVNQSPYYTQNKAAMAAQSDAAAEAAKADAIARKPVPLNQSPYYTQNQATMDAQTAAQNAQPKIVDPFSPAPKRVGNEGRAATWTNERVMQLAKQGDTEAISQAVRRGMELPPNARYVMGDPSFGGSTYNPRDVTVFSPEGIPLRQGGKVQVVSDPFAPSNNLRGNPTPFSPVQEGTASPAQSNPFSTTNTAPPIKYSQGSGITYAELPGEKTPTRVSIPPSVMKLSQPEIDAYARQEIAKQAEMQRQFHAGSNQ